MILLQLKVLTEVNTAYHLVVCQLLGGTCFEDFTLVEEVGTVGDGEGFIDIVVGDNNADILVFEGCHDALDILHRNRVYARKWLVEQDKRRVDSDSTSNLGTTALTTRELVTVALAYLLQAELLDKRLGTLTLILLGVVGHLQHRADIILDGEVTEHRSLLCKVANAQLRTLIHRQIGKFVYMSIVVLEEYASLIWLDKSHYHIE